MPGAVQVPPDGAPVLFLADHPVTGGYPVLGVVVDGGPARGCPAATRRQPSVPAGLTRHLTGMTVGPSGPATTSARAP